MWCEYRVQSFHCQLSFSLCGVNIEYNLSLPANTFSLCDLNIEYNFSLPANTFSLCDLNIEYNFSLPANTFSLCDLNIEYNFSLPAKLLSMLAFALFEVKQWLSPFLVFYTRQHSDHASTILISGLIHIKYLLTFDFTLLFFLSSGTCGVVQAPWYTKGEASKIDTQWKSGRCSLEGLDVQHCRWEIWLALLFEANTFLYLNITDRIKF